MKFDDQENKASEKSTVVDLASFRKKKDVAEELTRGGRNPLYVSHKSGQVSSGPQAKRPEGPDFGDRLTRIRSSLEKINRLMSELKKMSNDANDATVAAPSSTTSNKH